MDGWFTSPKLFDHLWQNGTKAVGTVMPNRREMPKQALQQKLKKRVRVLRRREHLLAVKWRDVRDIYILSAKHDDEMVRGQHQKMKPVAVAHYKFKVGVDRCDQLSCYFSFHRRQLKWWKKLFIHDLDITIVNSYILLVYKKTHRNIRLQQYVEGEVEGLVLSAALSTDTDQPATPQESGRLIGRNHFPYVIPVTPGSKGRKGQW